jgi:hypothetical protein
MRFSSTAIWALAPNRLRGPVKSLHAVHQVEPQTSCAVSTTSAACCAGLPRRCCCRARCWRSRTAATGQLLQRRVLGGFVDAALQVVLVFQLAELGGHQAQHHGLALGQVAQRLEVAGAVVVVFQEVGVEVHLGQQRLGHRLVVAGGGVRALEVAAAQVHGQQHAFGFCATTLLMNLA